MKKRLLSFLIVLTLIMTNVPFSVEAAAPVSALKLDKQSLKAGDTFTLSYVLPKAVSGVNTIEVKIAFDNTVFQAVEPDDPTNNPNPKYAQITGFGATGWAYSKINSDGGIQVSWMAVGGVPADIAANTELFSVKMKVISDDVPGASSFTVTSLEITDEGGDDLAGNAGVPTSDSISPTVQQVLSEVSLNITAPVAGAEPTDATITETEYTGTGTWGSSAPAKFLGDTEYTATFTLTPTANYVFDSTVAAKVNGEAATSSTTNSDGTLTVTHKFKTDAATITGIAVKTPPTKTTYVEGQFFNPSGLVLTVKYNDDTTKEVSAPNSDITYSPDTSNALATTDTSVTISYGGETATQAITVVEKAIESIAITTPPTKTKYKSGESFDSTGMVMTATYNDGTKAVLNDDQYEVTSPTGKFSGDGQVTVTVQEKVTTTEADRKTAETIVTVNLKNFSTDVTVTLGEQKVYNATNQGVVIVSVKDGSTELVEDRDYKITSGNTAKNVGDNILLLTGIGDYSGTQEVTWTLLPVELAATDFVFNNFEKTYDETTDVPSAFTITVAPSKVQNSDTITVTPTNPAYADANVGTDKTITVASVTLSNNNYKAPTGAISATNGVITTAPQTPTITAAKNLVVGGNTLDLDKLVSGAKGAITYTLDATTYAELESDGHTLKSKNTANQTVKITVNIAAVDKNNDSTPEYDAYTGSNAITVTITDKAVKSDVMTVEQADVEYGTDVSPTLKDDPADKVGEVTYQYTGHSYKAPSTNYSSTEAPTDAGEYKVAVTCETLDTIYEAETEFKITKKDIKDATITLKETTPFTWDGSVKTVTLKAVELGSEPDIKDDVTIQTGSDKGTDAGDYTLTITANEQSNYKGTKTLDWKINKAASSATAPTPADNLEYNGNGQELLKTAGTPTGGTMQYSIDGQTWSEAFPKETNAGSYTVYYGVKGDSNHEDNLPAGNVTVEIARQPVAKPTASATTFEFDGTEKTAVEAADGYTITDGSKTNKGSYTAVAKLDDNHIWDDNTTADYEISWEITKKETPDELDDISKKVFQGVKETLKTIEINLKELLPTDRLGDISGYQTAGEQTKGANNSELGNIVISSDGILTADVVYSVAGDTVVIPLKVIASNTDANVKLNVIFSAKPIPEVKEVSSELTKTYDGAAFEPKKLGTATYEENTLEGEWTLTKDGTEVTVTNVKESGDYQLNFKPTDDTYDTPSPITVKLTVNPAKLTITAQDQTVTVGSAKPAFTYKVTGMVNGESESTALVTPPTLTTDADMNVPGDYKIVVGTDGVAGDNYVIETRVDGTLTVEAKEEPVVEEKEIQIVFDSNGGTGTMNSLTVKENGSSALTSNAFTRSGYDFDGWNTKKDGTGETFADGATVTYDQLAKLASDKIELYAQWKEKDTGTGGGGGGTGGNPGGGSGSRGGGSSGGGSSSVSSDKITIDVDSESDSLKIEAEINGANAVVAPLTDDQIKRIITSDKPIEHVIFDLTSQKEVRHVEIPYRTIDAISDTMRQHKGDDRLIVKTAVGELDFDEIAIETILDAKKGTANDGVVFSYEIEDHSKLNDRQQRAIRDKDVHHVLDLSVTVGGVRVSDFGGGNVYIHIPMELKPGQNGSFFQGYYMSPEGEMEAVETSYANALLTLIAKHFSNYVVMYEEEELQRSVFKDVEEGQWFYDAVYYCYDQEYFKGMTEDTFAPNGKMTRAMFATVLYRIAGKPNSAGENPFTDVENGKWYTDAIVWAAENGIINGVGNGRFKPNDNVTREQMVTMFWRYNGTPAARGGVSAFNDADQISSYARDAFAWAVNAGVVNGKGNGRLDPLGTSTRAEVAQIVMNYDQIEK